jgi:hypothetical protein
MDNLLTSLLAGIVSGSVVSTLLGVIFYRRAKIIEATIQRRSRLEEKLLLDRFALLTKLSLRLEQVMSTLFRRRNGEPPPAGFFAALDVGNRLGIEITPLSEIHDELLASLSTDRFSTSDGGGGRRL